LFSKKVGIYIKKISRPETERKKVKSKKEPKKLTVWIKKKIYLKNHTLLPPEKKNQLRMCIIDIA